MCALWKGPSKSSLSKSCILQMWTPGPERGVKDLGSLLAMAPPTKKTSCEIVKSFRLIRKKTQAKEGEAKTGRIEKSAVSLCRHLASCGWPSLNKDELMGPFSGGTFTLQKGGKEALLRAQCGQSWCWQPNWASPVPGRVGGCPMPPTRKG